jgi:MFS family permease
MIRLLIAALSAVVGALAVGLLFMLTGIPRTAFGWVWVAVIFLIGFVVGRVCLSLGLNTSAAFEKGAREAAVEGRGDSFEATGRRAGAVVGKGLNKVARIGAPKASPTPTPSPKTPSTTADTASGAPGPAESPSADPEPPKPEVTVDKAARVIGSMVGRRNAERRNRS